MNAYPSYRVFVVRLHPEGDVPDLRWRGRIELVGSDEHQMLEGTAGIVPFIEQHLRRARAEGPLGAPDTDEPDGTA
jgi:hypothetical protein